LEHNHARTAVETLMAPRHDVYSALTPHRRLETPPNVLVSALYVEKFTRDTEHFPQPPIAIVHPVQRIT